MSALALAVVIAQAGILHAQQSGSVSSRFSAAHRGPVNISGRQFVYDYKTDTFIVKGNAVLTQAATTLTANQIDLIRREHRAHAVGDVHLLDPAGEILATQAEVNLDTETADLTDAKILAKDKTYRLEGKKITKLKGQHYAVLDGLFTTCGKQPGTPDWSISASKMDVRVGEEGTARDVRFNILGYPVIHLPYAVFPAATERRSGFLSPRIGESGLRGFQYLQPYFLDINRSSDATFAFDVETSQRVGLLGEYRLVNGIDDYLSVNGAFYNESLRSQASRVNDVVDNQIADPHIPINRYGFIAKTRQHLTDNLTAYADTISVSDSLYLREMDIWTLSRGYGSSFNTLRNAVSHFGLVDSYDNGFARLDGVWNQDLIQPQEFALQTLPELLVSGRRQLLGGLAYADYDAQAVHYWRSQGVSGWRFDLYPRVTVPWRLGEYLYGFGTLGLRETMYDVSGRQIAVTPIGTQDLKYNNGLTLGSLGRGGFFTREMIDGSAGVATEIEKVYDLNWKSVEKIKHIIKPFVMYSYVPSIDQSELPLFDQTDRVNPRSLITYGFRTQIFAKLPAISTPAANEGTEQEGQQPLGGARAASYANGSRIEEILDFDLLQAYDTNHAIAKGESRFSDLQATATIFPTHILSLGSTVGFAPRQQQVRYASFYLNFQPPWTNDQQRLYMGKALTGSFLQLAYNYIGPGPGALPGTNANFSEFVSMRAYYDLFDRLGVFFSPAYDIASHRLIAAEYGVRIKSPCDCWAVDVGITDTVNPSDVAVQFQVTLGGIGSIGHNPFGRNPFQERMGVLPTLY